MMENEREILRTMVREQKYLLIEAGNPSNVLLSSKDTTETISVKPRTFGSLNRQNLIIDRTQTVPLKGKLFRVFAPSGKGTATVNRNGVKTMLKEVLAQDLIQAMRDKDTIKKAVLTVLKAALQNEEIKLKRELTQDDELTILNRERKQINDSIEGYITANRYDLVEKEELKLKVVESYLPKQLTPEEILSILETKGITKEENVGKLIGALAKEYKGQVDGKTLSTIVKEFISKL